MSVEENIGKPKKKKKRTVGVDFGIKNLAVLSNGKKFKNPEALSKYLRRIKRMQRKVSKRKKGSKNREKARKRLAKLYYKVHCIRKDTIHKITTYLTKTKSRVVIEDLAVQNMSKNYKLAQAIMDVGFYEFRRQLEYKGKWYGCKIIIANRFYPSSKTCSSCGRIRKNLKLSTRTYKCQRCGLILDRDINAAKNLRQLVVRRNGQSTVRPTGINAYGEGRLQDEFIRPVSLGEVGSKH